MNEILKFIYAIVLFQEVVFIVFILIKSKLKTSQQIIILFFFLSLFFCVTDRVINIYAAYFSKNLPWSLFILDTFNLLYLPLVFLFIKAISARLWKPFWHELIHFAPFIYSFTLVVFNYTLKPAHEQHLIQQSFTSPGFFYTNRLSYYIIEYARLLQIIYAFISVHQLSKFQKSLKNNIASPSSFLKMFQVILVSFIILWFANFCFKEFIETYSTPFIDILLVVTSVLFIYYGLKKPSELFGIQLFEETNHIVKNIDYKPYKLQLEQHVAKYQPHLDYEITLNKLSEQSGISCRILSATINNCYKMHFFDYINSLRIEEAKKLLKQTNKTVLEILYQVGFNSKSAFNRAFLKHTGTSPSKFRKSD